MNQSQLLVFCKSAKIFPVRNAWLRILSIRKHYEIWFKQYDHEITRSTRNSRTSGSDLRDIGKSRGPSPGTTTSKSPDIRNDTAHKGPHQILAAAGSAEKVRNRNAKSLLMDFFGLWCVFVYISVNLSFKVMRLTTNAVYHTNVRAATLWIPTIWE